MRAKVKKYAKGIIAVLAAAGFVASSGALDGAAELWLNVGIGAVSAALVVFVPNAPVPRRPKRSGNGS